MSTPPPALDEARLRRLVANEPFVRRLVVFDRVGSTNDALRELAAAGAEPGSVILAETQTAGRGRHGRHWYSPRGTGLLISVLLRPGAPPALLTRWTLGAALAACEACRRLSGADVLLDWPNDLVHDGRKLGGVLAELRSEAGSAGDLIIGTGLNVEQPAAGEIPAELASRATSLRLASGGGTPRREELAAAYLRGLAAVARELSGDGWGAVASRWERLAPGVRGQAVEIASGAGEPERPSGRRGITSGIDDVGALRVRMADGRLATVHSAASVRALEV